jgi:hypothetical protein
MSTLFPKASAQQAIKAPPVLKQTLSLTQSFESLGVPMDEREAITAVAAARRVAYGLPLPAEPVGSGSDYYDSAYASQANQAMGSLNEGTVLDYDFALFACRQFWLCRYAVLHEPESPEVAAVIAGMVEKHLAMVSERCPTGAMEALHALDMGAPYASLSHTFDALWGSDSKGG